MKRRSFFGFLAALPIMAVNRCAGKRHSWMQYTQVSLITAGVVMFMFYREGMDDKEQQANTLQGAALLLIALGFDGLTGHLEDAVIKEMEWKHGQVLCHPGFVPGTAFSGFLFVKAPKPCHLPKSVLSWVML